MYLPSTKYTITTLLRFDFTKTVAFDPLESIEIRKKEQLPVEYFSFYNATSSVYSSKIEGEEIDFDSFFKHKFLGVPYNPDYTKKADDLYKAYEFIQKNRLSRENVFAAHKILSQHLLTENQRGKVRNNPMFVLNANDRIEYVACAPEHIEGELAVYFEQVAALLESDLSVTDTFFYAAQVHLVFVKIHPFQDGNGRTARLLEKWFLLEKLGQDAVSVELEKNYFINRTAYYDNLRIPGLEYQDLDYSKALPFLLMTVNSLE